MATLGRWITPIMQLCKSWQTHKWQCSELWSWQFNMAQLYGTKSDSVHRHTHVQSSFGKGYTGPSFYLRTIVCHFRSLLCLPHVWADGWVGYVNTITDTCQIKWPYIYIYIIFCLGDTASLWVSLHRVLCLVSGWQMNEYSISGTTEWKYLEKPPVYLCNTLQCLHITSLANWPFFLPCIFLCLP
jgi:hypothetical protein